jgi:predicted enzyme related to lactoylglutathione lyase
MSPVAKHTPGSFCWFELATTDQAAAKTFYEALFSWTPQDTPMGPTESYTIFRIKDRQVAAAYTMRAEQRAQGVPPNWMPYVLVKSADEWTERAKALGAKIVMAPMDVMDAGRMSILADPTGAVFALWQTKANPGTGLTGEHGTAVWADLNTSDPAKAAKFYTDLFGWQIVGGKDMRPAGPGDYAHIVNGKDFIGGIPPGASRGPSCWLIYFDVANASATIGQATKHGGRVVAPLTEMEGIRRFAVLNDGQGATFAIVQELGTKPPAPKPAPKASAKPAPRPVAAKKPAKPAKPAKAAKPARRKAAKPAAKPKAKRTARPKTRRAPRRGRR